jgi:hypothetical protein
VSNEAKGRVHVVGEIDVVRLTKSSGGRERRAVELRLPLIEGVQIVVEVENPASLVEDVRQVIAWTEKTAV